MTNTKILVNSAAREAGTIGLAARASSLIMVHGNDLWAKTHSQGNSRIKGNLACSSNVHRSSGSAETLPSCLGSNEAGGTGGRGEIYVHGQAILSM